MDQVKEREQRWGKILLVNEKARQWGFEKALTKANEAGRKEMEPRKAVEKEFVTARK